MPVEFHSILFPTRADETSARTHPWLTLRKDRAGAEDRFVLRGNKYVRAAEGPTAPPEEKPVLFEDIRMDQVMDQVLDRDADRDLAEVFYALCPDDRVVSYRQDIMRSLERPDVLDAFEKFCRSVGSALILMDCGKTAHHAAQRDKYRVDGATRYADAIRRLLWEAPGLSLRSEGLLEFLDALRAYAGGVDFVETEGRARRAKAALERVNYRLRVSDGRVLLGFESPETDLAREIADDFVGAAGPAPTEAGEARSIRLFGQMELCPLEAMVMDALRQRFEREFSDLHEAAGRAEALPAAFVARFAREMRFYFRYLDLMNRMRSRGHSFAYPERSVGDEVAIAGAYDLALALKSEGVVANDLSLTAGERGAVITGANQAGKTTFLRSVGQVAVLSALGLPAPCARARLPLYRRVYSHFGEAEDSSRDHGKLKEELIRLKPALLSADRDSLVLLNEPFSSTTAQDAMEMAGCALSALADAGARVLLVTHITGLKIEGLISLAAQIDPISHRRLYRIAPAPAEGHAYADEIAKEHHLTYREIKERIEHGI